MKKIIFVVLSIIIIPYIVVTLFIKDDEIKFKFVSNNVVRVKREATNEIEIVPFEEYVKGVLAGEMPASFHIEALKAQAVAARSYVLKKMVDNKNKEYDVVDTIENQVYLDDETLKKNWKNNYENNMNKIKKAIIETKGEYLTYDNEIINAFFFSTSSGKTENCEEVFVQDLPYLKSVDSSWDIEISPVYNNVKTFTLKEFYQKIGLKYQEKLEIEIVNYTKSGSIKTIKINNKTFKGTDIRSKLSLKSTSFSIKKENKEIIITTKGNGHGVGMSQYGAYGMAKEGYNYEEILKHYYTGVEIKKI
ncbi:MAG: stage II sporulation protein D [Bacilli bacterium]|nr:stage II sporulation protein D [Bacilli bacterium]